MIKKTLIIAAAAILLCTCTAVAVINDELEILPVPSYEIGDVNSDFAVNVKDATAVQKHLAGIITLSESQLKRADTNLDGTVNIKDATYIQKLVAGLVEPMKPTPAQTESTAQITNEAEVETETTLASEPAESTAATQPQTSDPAETTLPQETLHTTEPAETESTSAATDPTQPATKNPNKPIELPFIPAA